MRCSNIIKQLCLLLISLDNNEGVILLLCIIAPLLLKCHEVLRSLQNSFDGLLADLVVPSEDYRVLQELASHLYGRELVAPQV